MRCCSVYEKRPPGCRAFVCHLGRRLELGDVAFPEALATKEVAIGALAAKGSKAFRLEVDGPGIVAFKYSPFSGS